MVVSGISTVSYMGLRRAAHSMALDSGMGGIENQARVELAIQNAIAAYGASAVGRASALLNLLTGVTLDIICNAEEGVAYSRLVRMYGTAKADTISGILDTMFNAMALA